MGPAGEVLAADRLGILREAACDIGNGRREGGAWRVGDIDNTPGRSLMVRLTGPESGKGACAADAAHRLRSDHRCGARRPPAFRPAGPAGSDPVHPSIARQRHHDSTMERTLLH
jgi:hypothetical protein